MPPIELGPLGPQSVRGPRAVDAKAVSDKAVEARPVANEVARSHASESSAVVRSTALDVGTVPVDGDRVAVIRKAIEQGHYPVLPTTVADAIIAAGFLLRSGK